MRFLGDSWASQPFDRIGQPAPAARHGPLRALWETERQRYVEVGIIGFVYAGYVAVDHRQWHLPLRHHLNQVLGHDCVAVDYMDVDPAAELFVEVLHTVEIFGVSLHINVAPHKLGLVSDESFSPFPGLHKH